jgi:hypothetical protein
MESNKKIAPAGYVVAFMLFTLPLLDGLVTLWPFRFEEERWRFGAVGSVGNLTLVPVLGIFVAIAVATVSDHRRTRQVLGIVSAVLAIFFAGAFVVFTLDYLQVRSLAPREGLRVIDVVAIGSMIKQVLTVLALTLLARAGLTGPKKSLLRDIPAPEASPTPLIRPGGARAG